MKYTKLFAQLNKEFKFTLDACAEQHNKRCAKFFSPKENGLKQSWEGETVWCHPPFGDKQIFHWLQKAGKEADINNVTSVLFLPKRNEDGWLEGTHQTIQWPSNIQIITKDLPEITSDVPQMYIPNPVMLLIFKSIKEKEKYFAKIIKVLDEAFLKFGKIPNEIRVHPETYEEIRKNQS